MKVIGSLLMMAFLTSLYVLLHPAHAMAVGIELRPITLKGLRDKDYLIKGIDRLLRTRLNQMGLTTLQAQGVNLESGYVLGGTLTPKRGEGLEMRVDLWRKKDLYIKKRSTPLKTFTQKVPNEEGLFHAIREISKEIAQFIQLDQESLALKPVGKVGKSPPIERLPLKNTEETSIPIEATHPKGETPRPQKVAEESRDYIPDQVPDLPPEEEDQGLTHSPREEEGGGIGGIFSLFWPHHKKKATGKRGITPYTNELIVPTPEEIIMKESQKASQQATRPQKIVRNTDDALEIKGASTHKVAESHKSPRNEGTTQGVKASTTRQLPKWKWF